MNPRPRPITVISWIFIAVGFIALLYHLSDFKAQRPFDYGLVWVALIRFLAVLGGAVMLRGFNWARWLLAVWMAYHIVLSIFHSPVELMMHVLLFGIIGYFLFRPQSSAYFQGRRSEPKQTPETKDTSVAK